MDPTQINPNIADWFALPAVGIATVLGFVAWLRKSFPKIDGKYLVPAITLAVGALFGAAGQQLQLLTVEPYATLPFPWGGIWYGLYCAGSAVGLVSTIQYVFAQWTKYHVTAQVEVEKKVLSMHGIEAVAEKVEAA